MKIQKYKKRIETVLILGLGFLLYRCAKERIQDNDEHDQYDKVKKYFLNNTSLAKSKLPILWIHVPYEHNSRNWENFGSRKSEELNQPYLFLTIKSIINKCGKDFNICMLDDSAFLK